MEGLDSKRAKERCLKERDVGVEKRSFEERNPFNEK
jgi:hypothetical protein